MTSLRFGAATDTGKVRANNQDAVLVAEPMFAVADGMGGHAAGEIASEVAVESLQASAPSNLEDLVMAVRQANRAVWERAAGDPELRGMGTTLCAIALVPAQDSEDSEDSEAGLGTEAGGTGGDQIIVVNVGDSRVYQFHDGDITQVTDDHSLVEDLVREGRLSQEEARTHPQRNILTRVLGNEPDVEVDSWELVPQRGDRYLLCSDGLFNEVDDDRLASVLRRLDDPEDAAHELVSLANQGGGRDNISVVVVDVVDDDDRAAAASAALAGAGATSTVPSVPSAPRPTTSVSPAVPAPAPSPPAGGGPGHRATSSSASDSPRSPRPRRVTWRSVLFVFCLLVVLGGGAGAVAWFAGSTYYVGFDDEQVAIFRGRPGGLLWVQPTLAERTSLPASEVPPARREAVTAGKEAPSLDAARKYVAALEEQALAEQRRATTTLPPAPAPATGTGTGAITTATTATLGGTTRQ
ncbi:MAG: protein phosphatase 2C domain-containing protein [Acidimicrobiales bacterium]